MPIATCSKIACSKIGCKAGIGLRAAKFSIRNADIRTRVVKNKIVIRSILYRQQHIYTNGIASLNKGVHRLHSTMRCIYTVIIVRSIGWWFSDGGCWIDFIFLPVILIAYPKSTAKKSIERSKVSPELT